MMQIFLHLSTMKGMVMTSSLHCSLALPLTAGLLWNETTRGGLNINLWKLPAFIFSWVYLCLLCVFVFQNIKAIMIFMVLFKKFKIEVFFFFVFINLSVHHIVTQSFPPVQPLLIVGRTQLKKKNQADFRGGSVVMNLPPNPGDMDVIPDLARSHMPRSN